MKMFRMMAVALIAIGFSSVAEAQGFDQRRLFFGAGLGLNSISGYDDAVGLQLFGGYNIAEVAPKFHVDAEVGYMDSGKFKRSETVPILGTTVTSESSAKGLWAAGVGRYMITPQIELIGRLGYDFGDDDGLMVGLGGGYIVNKNLKLRVEYVVRDNIDSLQFNVLLYPW